MSHTPSSSGASSHGKERLRGAPLTRPTEQHDAQQYRSSSPIRCFKTRTAPRLGPHRCNVRQWGSRGGSTGVHAHDTQPSTMLVGPADRNVNPYPAPNAISVAAAAYGRTASRFCHEPSNCLRAGQFTLQHPTLQHELNRRTSSQQQETRNATSIPLSTPPTTKEAQQRHSPSPRSL